ncbi:alpha/beta hydrolase fold domain-containing protein [Pseudomonas sp. C27(2019)]|uniref:alpha/beta hydrolase n=1 Tax=Pseudomonas sp. C27(2019) TaxID=2604941 RepID=UPI001244B4F4|nr:alpha/beta fold hydrolase [Pseudomonas sp. C27(2019)]QEY59459.1 alpha/beta hydrolase fold domain-containing protein [Pseudomonas sp. C27(2019)]
MLARENPVMLDGPVGVLEALYLDVIDARGIALICHPNPSQGGTMLNKVVSSLQRIARDSGLTTLRFNFRGTGKSAGEHDMRSGEVDDAQAALAWLQEQHPDLPIYLFGFSFGGFVAGSLSGRLQRAGIAVEQLYLVAPAAMRFNAKHVLADNCKLTIIQPEDDEIIDPEWVYQWVSTLTQPHELLKVAECGHFFHGRLLELKQLVAERL